MRSNAALAIRLTRKIRSLSGTAFIWHYLIVIVAGLATAALTCAVALTWQDEQTVGMSAVVVTAVFTVAALWRRRRLLRYYLIPTERSALVNYDRVVKAARREGWEIDRDVPGETINMWVRGFPDAISWGEYVSVQFEGSDVYVNSIGHPEQHTAGVTWRRNREHVEFVEWMLQAE